MYLEKAKTQSYVVIYGDYGVAINLVSPVRMINCSKNVLEALCKELARISDDEIESGILAYEEFSLGDEISGVPGDEGRATDIIWISDHLRDLGLYENICKVLAGERDINHLFKPDLRSFLPIVKPGGSDQVTFERIIIQTFQSAGSVAWRGIYLKASPEDLYSDIYVAFNKERIFIYGNCTTAVNSIDDKLTHIADFAKSDKEEPVQKEYRKNWPEINKYVLFANVLENDIPSSAVSYAENQGISLLPSELLEELVIVVENRISAKDIARKLSAGIPS